MKFGSFFLLVLLVNLIHLNLGKKKELASIMLGFLLGSHRNNNSPQLIPLNFHNSHQGNSAGFNGHG